MSPAIVFWLDEELEGVHWAAFWIVVVIRNHVHLDVAARDFAPGQRW